MKARMNTLYYGDNLTVMQQKMGSNFVDLIYLDPPFNSKRNYNLMYKNMTGLPVSEQVEAFCDTWELDAEKEQRAKEMPILMKSYGVEQYYVDFWKIWVEALRNTQPHLLAYLIYMVERLLHMRSILKATGSIYLHCDPTASHYIKIMMDGIFGHENFRSEIIWKRTSGHSDARGYGSVHDVLLYYTKTNKFTWNQQYQAYDESYTQSHYRRVDKKGRNYRTSDLTAGGLSGGGYEYEWNGVKRIWRCPIEKMQIWHNEGRIQYTRNGTAEFIRYLDEMPGVPLQDIWTDISPINSQSKDRLGYPTQKPPALLKRIIAASSNPDDLIFDPFCGCGTTIYAAHETGRKWIGCDVAILSIKLVKHTLEERYRLVEDTNYKVDGIPMSVEAAQDLWKKAPHDFQHWFVERVGGFPTTRKSGDKGIDGTLYFECGKKLRSMVISVKGGKTLRPADVRELRGTMEREGDAEMAGFLSIQEPTKAMKDEAARAGVFEYGGVAYPRIQFLTVNEVLEGKKLFQTPTRMGVKGETGQLNLGLTT